MTDHVLLGLSALVLTSMLCPSLGNHSGDLEKATIRGKTPVHKETQSSIRGAS